MARARNIKPKFFQNDELGELDPLARLLFIGLWTVADFKGCLEYRPKRLKTQILPYDECSIEELAIALDKSGFIAIYSVLGQQYIKILKFKEHQNPHKNEKDAGSDCPDIDKKDKEISQLKEDGTTRDKDGTARADSLLLNPDSLFPQPDSGIPVEAPEKPKRKPDATATRLPADWIPSYADARFCESERSDISIDKTASRFRDYWVAQPGVKGRKVDWPATWRNWVRNEKAQPPPGGYQTANDKSKTLADRLTGKTRNEPDREIIDINTPPS